MHDDCPVCGLDFDRGDPGHFTGAMYVSYGLAIPLIALLTLIEYLIVPAWSLFRLVVLASLICVPLIPWIWQYSRVIWIYFDRYFDPEDDPQDRGRSGAELRATRTNEANPLHESSRRRDSELRGQSPLREPPARGKSQACPKLRMRDSGRSPRWPAS